MYIVRYIFLPAIISFFIAFVSVSYVIKFAKKFDLIDDPKIAHVKKIHKRPIPRGGGLAIFIAIFVTTLIFLPLDKHLVGILAGALLVVTVGIFDDKYDLSPYLRLVLGFVAAGLPIIAGIGIAFVSNPLGGIVDLSQPQITLELLGETRTIWVLSDIFALFWIVTLMNFINMGAKGVDGQLPGVVTIAAATIAALSLRFSADISQWPVIILAVIVSSAYLGFLPWNFHPQKIMPGYSGSTLAGYMLGVLSILSTTKVGTLLVVLGIPLIDTSYTIVRRIMAGKSPFLGDAGHLHHRLLKAGLSKKQVSYFYWGVTALLGIIALNLNAENKLYTIVGIIVAIGALLLILTKYENVKNT